VIEIVEYESEDGTHPFFKWVSNINTPAKLKVRIAVARMGEGNFSNVKAVGQGGTKKRQSNDIETAQALWKEYKRRKKEG
jgi:putative component of toxin-antitoxin plasmid stabilization module